MASGCWPRAPLRFSQLNMVAAGLAAAAGDVGVQVGGCLPEEQRVLMGGCLVEGEEKEGSRKVQWVEEGEE